MEYKRILYRSSFNVYEFMLKGSRMNYECTAENYNRCVYRRPYRGRYQPAKSKALSSVADKRYYKLHNGDILDLNTKTILDRDSLKALLTAL